jgi:hypothetical protein
MGYKILVLVLLCAVLPAACYADGLGTIMQVGKSMDDIQRAYDKETATYNRMKEAVGKGVIKKGTPQAAVLKTGEPVVIATEAMGMRQVWVYRPGTTDLLNKPKIRIFFDDNRMVDEISIKE